MRCLVVGATGYVGTRLVERLLTDGHAVRVLARDPARAQRASWYDAVQRYRGNVADPAVAAAACADVDAVFYLVHSMTGPDFAARDRAAARVLADAAAGARRVVYLGGLQPVGPDSSEHLRSRHEVGEILLAGAAPAAVLRAGVVVGSGSASFEMVRHLAEALPVLPAPAHADNLLQPIGIDDLLHWLVACLRLPADVRRAFDIGGPDALSYADLLRGHAEQAGLGRRLTLPIPVSAPRLAARAAAALTPVDRHLAGPLLESMAHELVCREDDLATLVGGPPGGRTPYAEAVRRALADDGAAGSRPTDRPGAGPAELTSADVREVAAPAERVWRVVEGLGGSAGWYTVPGVWELRGVLDRLVGGVGGRRGRPDRLAPGAAWDWWRVEEVAPGRSLTLRAEMRLPGTARLTLAVEPTGPDACRYVQRVAFRPRGAFGRAYWYGQLPAHRFVFAVMATTVAGVAERGPAPA